MRTAQSDQSVSAWSAPGKRADCILPAVNSRGNAPENLGDFIVKSTHFILPLVIASLAASAALADKHPKKPAKDWTCADFLAIDDEFKPKAVYWASAYSKRGKEEGDMLDIDGTEKVTPMIITACTKAPKESFWAKFKDEWHKMGRHHGKDKSDNKVMNMQGGSGTNNTGTSPNGTTNPGTTPNGTNDGSGNNNMQKQKQKQ